ncbi:MAG: trigger factor, partial [Chloroflexi bacterium]|nr:trigger factor [Chloroflexota bacterium]
ERLLPEAYERAVDEQKIEPIAKPKLEMVSVEPVKFKALVPLRPAVRLSDYRDIRVEHQPVEVKDEQVDATIDQLRQQHATWTPVERPAGFDDLLTVNIESWVGEKQLLKEKDVPYRLVKGLTMPLPGYPEKLVGMTKGETREFDLVFPDDHPAAEFRGKECHFKVEVTEMKEQSLPPVDDAFAKSIGAGVETAEALREKIRMDLKARMEAAERDRFEDQALEALVGHAQVEYPPVLLEAEIDRLVRQHVERLERSRSSLSDYLGRMNKTIEEFRQELIPLAEKRLLRSLAMGQLAEEEKIEVGLEETSGEVDRMSKGAGEKEQELRKFLELPSVRGSVENSILTRKTLERLLSIAEGKEAAVVAAPMTEPAAPAAPEPSGAGEADKPG